MAESTSLLNYLWIRLPLILLFVNGYLIYRLLVITGLTDLFVRWSLRRSHGRVDRILLYIIVTAALLSFFIPNAITVLTLLPILKSIDEEISLEYEGLRLTTPLSLSVIYGANIGGMGSLIGSPANLLLIAALDFFGVPGREQINFFSWFLWAVPLVVVFLTIAWALVVWLGVPQRVHGLRLRLPNSFAFQKPASQHHDGIILFGLFLAFWISEAVLLEVLPFFNRLEPFVCLLYFLVFVWFCFFRHRPALGRPLMRVRDVFSELPWRGLLFLGLLIAVMLAVNLLHLDRRAAAVYSAWIGHETSVFMVFLLMTLTVIFLTEVFSNTVVSMAFFSIAYYAALGQEISPLALMISVSIASTCAFMTPVATPCNALVFGEMKGTSLRRMLLLGLVLNMLGGLLMTLWLQNVIPLVYP
ncbi:MAG: anion permease [Acidobacteria bacterium]|nr:anion permease [Acidobacteriota bacterium]